MDIEPSMLSYVFYFMAITILFMVYLVAFSNVLRIPSKYKMIFILFSICFSGFLFFFAPKMFIPFL